jgi:DDE superfamily endonuclease
MARHSEFFKEMKTKPIHAKRLAAHMIEDVEEHFTEFARCKRKWGILDDDISNFDKTGFPISVINGEYVIVPTDCDVVYQADPANREIVTSVETLNYRGQKVPLMIIFLGAYHLRKHFDNDMDSDILFARSQSGFSNNKLGLVYLKHFDRFTKALTKGKYRMLIFDGHSSHITQPFIDYC